MFTGIITATAAVRATKPVGEGLKLTLERPAGWHDLALGESVATNGVCLTVDELSADAYECTLMPETLRVSAFGAGMPARVNLERALSAAARLSGHFVQGHVDGVGTVTRVETQAGYDLWVQYPGKDAALLVHKGSVAIDGVSLTVAELKGPMLRVSLIPHTLKHTTLDDLKSGDQVNLEYDMLGKYVIRFLEERKIYAKG